VTTGDFRITLEARRRSAPPAQDAPGAPPTATVTLAVSERVRGRWRPVDSAVVGRPGSWFWNVVSGPAALCSLSVDSSPLPGRGGRARASGPLPGRIELRLLVSPSLGCSEPLVFELAGRKLSREQARRQESRWPPPVPRRSEPVQGSQLSER
jgi:hypothetical protein